MNENKTSKNYDDLKNENKTSKMMNLKNENNLKNEDELKIKTTSKVKKILN